MKLVCRILRRRLCPTNGERDLESLRSTNNLPSFVGHKRGQRNFSAHAAKFFSRFAHNDKLKYQKI